MTRLARLLAMPAVLAVMLAGAVSLAARDGSVAQAHTARVVIHDNDASFRTVEAGAAEWGYAPGDVVVTRGEPVVFDSPSSNNYPHTVTSISINGRFPMVTAEFGTMFNSSTNFMTTINPGGSWTLETADLEPGHYLYYCWIHPWMTGTVTVLAAP